MFWDYFRKRQKVIDVTVDGERGNVEKKHKWLIFAIIAAIVFLAFGDFGNKESEKQQNVNEAQTSENTENFVRDSEERLEKILSTIKGAGNVNVMIVFESKSEKVLASDTKTQKETENGGDISKAKSSDEETVLLVGSGSEEKPYVLKEKMPVPTGVVVTATGANNENVRLEIYESVKALYGISGHRIKVASAKE